jgi:hypothetical protein
MTEERIVFPHMTEDLKNIFVHVEKEFKNVLVNNNRYTRLIYITMAMVIVMVAVMSIISFKALESRRGKVPPEQFTREESQVKTNAYLNVGFGLMTISLMYGVAFFKRKTRIVTTVKGIEYQGTFSKTFIPWDGIKDVKILNQGNSIEKCRIKGKEKEILFTPFFLDTSINYRFEKDGIFDERSEQLTGSIKKSRLYKEIMMRMEKK